MYPESTIYDKILTKYCQNDKIHVENFQERHFMRKEKPAGMQTTLQTVGVGGVGWGIGGGCGIGGVGAYGTNGTLTSNKQGPRGHKRVP